MFILRTTQNTQTLCRQNINVLNVEFVGTYSHQWAGVNCVAFPLLLKTVPPISEPFIYNGMSFSIPCFRATFCFVNQGYCLIRMTSSLT